MPAAPAMPEAAAMAEACAVIEAATEVMREPATHAMGEAVPEVRCRPP
jgi:hypothetical protein